MTWFSPSTVSAKLDPRGEEELAIDDILARKRAEKSESTHETISGRIAVVIGTRPEIIKLALVVRLLGSQASVIYTGQHFTATMSRFIGTSMRLPRWAVDLRIGGFRRGSQLGRGITALDSIFAVERPLAVVVQGDTNSALAGALAANAHEIPLIHVEAGLRSFDRCMPEEANRVLADHLADICCAPTEVSRRNLLTQGISEHRIAVTGNTVVEAVHAALPDPFRRLAIMRKFSVRENRYVLSTLHRPENVDEAGNLRAILFELGSLQMPVVFPVHPRTRRRIEEFNLGHLLTRLKCTEPLDYAEFLALAQGAAMLVSDSGGLQEEATVLKRPIVVVRRSTERPEIEGTFGIRIPPGPHLGSTLREWLDTAATRRRYLLGLESPYGDGNASTRVVQLIRNHQAINIDHP